ncbi:hypothetical protein BJ875DRAFT_440843 [Amylocarpus encephaloides]|uniref:Biogenesis of lysosome-related organelles complex 1 subunit 1 n=1 Tax=Amylocarpus encephaloides TaxID=45428 RepID=A0A9P8C7B1_9HELO|nr:hypothetical protein BJ875DRAFT_440843 [Amylocarpus encephaloides]
MSTTPSASGPSFRHIPSQPPSAPHSQTPSQAPSTIASTHASKAASTSKSLSTLSSNLPHTPSQPPVHSPETQRQIHESRTALLAQMSAIGQSATQDIQQRAQNLHQNSEALKIQQKDLVKATEGLRKDGDKLKKVAEEGGKRVKELGNVQNWAEVLERDFLVLGETIRLANRGSESGSSWSSYSGSYSEDEDMTEEGQGGVKLDADGTSSSVDVEGDVAMDGLDNPSGEIDKGKGKEETKHEMAENKGQVNSEAQTEVGGISTAVTMVGSASVSGTEPSVKSSVHTRNSAEMAT